MPVLIKNGESWTFGCQETLLFRQLSFKAFSILELRPEPTTRMPVQEGIDRDHDWRKLETAKEHFMGGKVMLQPLGCLSQPEARPQVYHHGRYT